MSRERPCRVATGPAHWPNWIQSVGGRRASSVRWWSSRRAVTALHSELLAYAQSLTLDTATAEDLVHETLLRVLQTRLPPEPKRLRPWAFRILKNLFLDLQRRQRVRASYLQSEAQLADERDDGDPVEMLLVRQAYERLAPRDREIICLIDILGFTYSEASEIIGVPVGTVMSRISRARRSMLELIEDSNVRPFRKRMKA